MDNNAQPTPTPISEVTTQHTPVSNASVPVKSLQPAVKMQAPRAQLAVTPVIENLPSSDTNQANLQPASSPKSKEHEPAPAPFPDLVKMSETELRQEEVEVEKELEGLIEKSPDNEKPKISEEARRAGLEHALQDIPMPAVPTSDPALPLSYEDAVWTKKKYKWKDSIAWLSALVIYHLKKIGFIEKDKKI